MEAKTEFQKLKKMESIEWKQRSRVQEIEADDRNTAYFHKRANTRQRINFISKIQVGKNNFEGKTDIIH
ncbi:hypothetical protein BVC80_497g30 [Macleaya cordata]|uniref:Uncharacterized protein n=1 Tax=Macleaya cordata TaxID=56857 RepID=A0A200Q8V8_MACCD|nr:hypothetical protein BVC80_497g30 [Macleaya cordata]